MSTSNFELKAVDTLFFRDARPFTAGEEVWANSVFPEIPGGALLGALRTAYGAAHGISIEAITESTDKLVINGFWLKLGGQITFPVPMDLIGVDGNTRGLTLTDMPVSSNPFSYVLRHDGSKKADDLNGYRMPFTVFREYLQGKREFSYGKSGDDLLKLSDYLSSEPKTGIARQRGTRTVRSGALFRVGMTRTEGRHRDHEASILVSCSGLDLPPSGSLRLGGEGKVARFSTYTQSLPTINVVSPSNEQRRFIIYLMTPAFLGQGSLPSWIEEEDGMRGRIGEVEVKLLTVANGRYQGLGGFDLQTRRPKPLERTVPAGSVYYFELGNHEQAENQLAAIQQHLSQFGFTESRRNEGYGAVLIGKLST